MKLFLYLCLSATLATLVCWGIIYTTPGFPYGNLLGSGIFVIFLAISIGVTRSELSKSSKAVVAAPIVFVVSILLLTLLSMFLYELAPILLTIFASPMDVLGYYPPGPDMYFPYAATIWLGSMLVLMAVGISLGLVVRAVRVSGATPDQAS